MLKDTEIRLVSLAPADPNYFGAILDGAAMMALRNLVLRSSEYLKNRMHYGDVWAKLTAARTAAVAAEATDEQKWVAQVLAAVVLKLRRTIGIRVEDEGSQEARSFYSSPQNWDELALDVLNAMFLPPGEAQAGIIVIATRSMVSDFAFGRRPNDELYNTVRRRC